jgi:hypothetical protein
MADDARSVHGWQGRERRRGTKHEPDGTLDRFARAFSKEIGH